MALHPQNHSFGRIPWPTDPISKLISGSAGSRPVRELTVNQFYAMQSMISRATLSSALQQTFAGKRDMYAACGYMREITYNHYRFRYDRNDIAGRIVDIPALYTWRNPPQVVDGDGLGATPTEFRKAWTKIVRKKKIWSVFERLDRVSGIGRFGVMFIGINGHDINQLKTPVVDGSLKGPDAIGSLSVFGEDAVKVELLDTNPGSERFNLPELYRINLARSFNGRDIGLGGQSTVLGLPMTQGASTATGDEVLVHWSRIIHFAENLIDDEVYGMPRLQRVWNLLDDMAKVVGGSAETFWQVMDRGFQVDVDKELEMEPEDEKDLTEQLDRYQNRLQRYLKTRGVTVNPLGADTVNPRAPFSVITSLIVGTTGIPLRILFGPERGQFAVGEERTGWLESINDRQEGLVEQMAVRPFIDRLIQFGALPAPVAGEITAQTTATMARNPNSPRAGMNDDSNYACLWPDLLSGSDAVKADTAFKFAQAAEKFAQQEGNGGRLIVSPDEARQRWFALPAKKQAKIPEDNLSITPQEQAAAAAAAVAAPQGGGEGAAGGGAGGAAVGGNGKAKTKPATAAAPTAHESA